EAMASQYREVADRYNDMREAREAIRRLQEGREVAEIYREGQLVVSTGEDVTTTAASSNTVNVAEPGNEPVFASDPRTNRRLVVVPLQVKEIHYTLAVLEPLDKLEGEIGRIRNIILFGLPAALILTAGIGFLLARKSLVPVVTISEQAEHIGAKNLSERLKVRNPDDELGRLTAIFNA